MPTFTVDIPQVNNIMSLFNKLDVTDNLKIADNLGNERIFPVMENPKIHLCAFVHACDRANTSARSCEFELFCVRI